METDEGPRLYVAHSLVYYQAGNSQVEDGKNILAMLSTDILSKERSDKLYTHVSERQTCRRYEIQMYIVSYDYVYHVWHVNVTTIVGYDGAIPRAGVAIMFTIGGSVCWWRWHSLSAYDDDAQAL